MKDGRAPWLYDLPPMSAHLRPEGLRAPRWRPVPLLPPPPHPGKLSNAERPVPRATGPSRAQPSPRGRVGCGSLWRLPSIGRAAETEGMKVMAPDEGIPESVPGKRLELRKRLWARKIRLGTGFGELADVRLRLAAEIIRDVKTLFGPPNGAKLQLPRPVSLEVDCDLGTTHGGERRLVQSHPRYVPTTQPALFGSRSTRSRPRSGAVPR